jgi:Cd2+/Zn2+-exporting ATPase
MAEKNIEIDLQLLLPGVEAENDACISRLETSLRERKDLNRAHIERDKSPVTLCLHYDPDVLTLEEVKHLAERAGAKIINRYHHALIPIEGMDCSDCALVLEHSLSRMDGVLMVNVSFPAQKMRIEYDSRKTDQAAIEKRVRSLGYSVPVEGFRNWFHKNRELVFCLACGLFLLIGWLGSRLLGFPAALTAGIYLAAYVFGGWNVVRLAFYALRERHLDTDLLMVVAAIGAALLGKFSEGALLLFLFSLGHVLEERALDRARSAIRALADLTPKTALVKRNGSEIELPVDQLQLGDVVIVRPGVRMPVDGVILTGRSGVDQSPVTGESVPVDKTRCDKVFAGTINGEGALEVSVTRLAKDSTLARVMKMVEEAQMQKSPTQQLTEKFEHVFVPVVLLIDALLIILPPLFGVPFHDSFLRAMTLLVATSPCALALGTPATILAGVARAAHQGVLVKGGAHLENLGRLKAIAFDKTGTITHGRPEVTDVVDFNSTNIGDIGQPTISDQQSEILALAAAVESRSGHPLGQAVLRAAQAIGLSLPQTGEVESLTGRGLRSSLNSKPVLIGNLSLMEEAGVQVSEGARQRVDALQSRGKTLMLVAVDSHLVGALGMADTLRPETAPTQAALKRLGLQETIMLTGDNARVAAAIAQQADLADFRSDLMPEDKVTAVRSLVAEYGQVAMVGDGVNDAPALANATVGIAMGGAGTDVALETADVVLMSDDLGRLPFAVGLGRATRAVIIQNLAIAMGVIVLLALASLTGWVGMGIAILFHEGSTVLVVLNALRLLGFAGR